MAENTTNTRSNSVVDFGFLLFGLTVSGYCITWAYKSGCFSFFKIPITFINVDASAMLNECVNFYGIAAVSFLLINFDLVFLSEIQESETYKKSKLHLFIYVGLLTYPWIFLLITIFGPDNIKWIFIIVTLICGLLVGIIWRESHKNREPEKSEPTNETPQHDIDDILSSKLGFRPYQIISTVFMVGVLMFYFGRTSSRIDLTHTVIKANPEMFVVDSRGDDLICKAFNRSKKTFNEDFFILSASDKRAKSFKEERIGPLTFEPQLTIKNELKPNNHK